MEKDKDLEGCTFTPQTLKKKSYIFSNNVSVEERNMTWDRMRQNKVDMKKFMEKDKELEECTFRPAVNGHRFSLDPPSNRIMGYEEYIERQQRCRKEKQNREKEIQKCFKTGAGWKNQVTVPKEFHFGRPPPVIKALKKVQW